MDEIDTSNMQDLGLCVCGGHIYADTGMCAVIHTISFCEAFERLELIQFLSYVRRLRMGSDN